MILPSRSKKSLISMKFLAMLMNSRFSEKNQRMSETRKSFLGRKRKLTLFDRRVLVAFDRLDDFS